MTCVSDIYNFLDEWAPFESQEDWDNSGLLIGDASRQVNTVAVTLDITPAVVEAAQKFNTDLLISHHPCIFTPKRKLSTEDIVYILVQSGMSVICAHTNFDCAHGGVNDVLAEKLALENVVAVAGDDNAEETLLRMGTLKETLGEDEKRKILKKLPFAQMDPMGLSSEEFAALVKEKLGCNCLRYNKGERLIKVVAVCGGAGGSVMQKAIDAGADAYVTGDAAHHDFLEAKAAGVTLVSAGHFITEDLAMEPLARKIAARFRAVKVIRLKQNDPVLFL